VTALVLLGAAVLPATAASAPALVDEANRLFKEGKLDDALKLYTQAQLSKPDSPEIQIGIGNVFYRKGEFDKAREAYQRAFAARDGKLAQSARFNSGTANLSEQKYKEAIEDYKDALRANPQDAEARKNLELALMKLQKQQPPPQNDQDKKDDKKQDQKQQKSPQQPKDGEQKKDDKPQAAPTEERPSTPTERKDRQEAERILDALKGADKPKAEGTKQRRPDKPPEKDW